MEPRWVAIPLFTDEVAPRFCFARWILLAELADGAVTQRKKLDVQGFGWLRRLSLLSERQVKMLVCGGFNRRYLPFTEALGIFVSWGHTGPVESVIERLCAGDPLLTPTENQPDPGCGPRQGRGQGRRRRQRPGTGTPQENDE
jgi:predicted Fe-Mo cluster-binding NifX family protein